MLPRYFHVFRRLNYRTFLVLISKSLEISDYYLMILSRRKLRFNPAYTGRVSVEELGQKINTMDYFFELAGQLLWLVSSQMRLQLWAAKRETCAAPTDLSSLSSSEGYEYDERISLSPEDFSMETSSVRKEPFGNNEVVEA